MNMLTSSHGREDRSVARALLLLVLVMASFLWLEGPRLWRRATEQSALEIYHDIFDAETALSEKGLLRISALNETKRKALARHLQVDLQSPDVERRRSASLALLALGTSAEETASALTQAVIQDPDYQVRRRAAAALGRVGLAAAPAVPVLTQALAGGPVSHRAEIAFALRGLGPQAAGAREALDQASRDKNSVVRASALEAVSAIRIQPQDSLDLAIKGLQDSNPAVRGAAVDSLAQLGAGAAKAIPALRPLLQDREIILRMKTVNAFEQMGAASAPAAAALGQLLIRTRGNQNADVDLRWAATQALASSGEGAKAALPALVQTLRDPQARVRAGAVNALQAIGGTDPKVLQQITHLHDDPDPSVRLQVLSSLTKRAPAEVSTRLVLQNHLKDPSLQVAKQAEFLLQVAQKAASR